MPPVARLISLGILTTLIVALGITFYHVLAPFLLPLFLAWIVAIVCRPLYLWCVWRMNNRPRLAAGVTTAGILIVVLLPFAIGTVFAAVQLIDLAQSTLNQNTQWRARLDELIHGPYVIGMAERIAPYLPNVPVEQTVPTDTTDPLIVPPEATDDPLAIPETPTLSEEFDAEIATDRLHQQIDASLRATLKYIGSRTIGAVGEVSGIALGLLGRFVSLLVAIVMFGIGLYYFLCDGPELLAAAENLIPVQTEHQQELLRRFNQVVRAVVLSTFLSAFAQGLLTTFALGLAGFNHLMVFFLLSSLTAMIPLAGTWVVWVPCVALLIFREHAYGWALFVTIFGAGVIGTVDNLIRTYILNTNARLHPLLAFVSVLGGLQAMGLWGVFIGPIVAACLHALVQIFNTELKAFSNERLAMMPGTASESSAASDAAPETVSPDESAPARESSRRAKRRRR